MILAGFLSPLADILKGFFFWFVNLFRAFGAAVLDTLPDIFAFFGADQSAINVTLGLMENINYFFPLDECVTFGVILLSTWVYIIPYRLVKSWIPTVSS